MYVLEVASPENRHLIPSPAWSPGNVSMEVNETVMNYTRGDGLSQLEEWAIGGDLIFIITLLSILGVALLVIYLYGLASSVVGSGLLVKRGISRRGEDVYSEEYIYRGWRKELRSLYLRFLKRLRDGGIHILSGYTALEVASEARKKNVRNAFEVARLYNKGMFSPSSDISILDKFRRYVGDEG